MKFKKDGNVFEDIVAAVKVHCVGRDCDECGLLITSGTLDCFVWADQNPAEAARLMGCEVVEERSNEMFSFGKGFRDIRKDIEANMDKRKPFSEWTTGEVKAYCNGRDCINDCFIFDRSSGECRLYKDHPNYWDLSDVDTRFTEEEVADARAITRIMYLVWDDVMRDITGELCLKNRSGNRMPIQHNLFPSILPGTSVKLSDIAGGGDG